MLPSQLLAALEHVWSALEDLADIRELLSVNRDKLNLDYLQHQAARLGLHIPIEA